MKKFKINKFITLELDGNITKIHVERHHFVMWYSSISISQRNEEDIEKEFNNRYLSIQKWVESEYDTTLLPNNIAFPLLKKLFESREPIAKNVFKREVLKRFLSGESNVVNLILANRYLNLFSEEELSKIFVKKNLNLFSEGIISPHFLKRLKQFDENFAKLVLKKDINFYIKSENFEILDSILREDLFTAFSEEELKDFDLKKLDGALFELLKENLDYYITDYYYLEDGFKIFQKISEFLIFRTSESAINFFQRKFSILTMDHKVALISYLLFDRCEINQKIIEKIQKDLMDLDWGKISEIVIKNLSHASGVYKNDVILNENTINLLEKYDITFLNKISEIIKEYLNKITLDYGLLYEEINFNLFGVLLENNPRFLLYFLSKHYSELKSEEKCLFMTLFIVNNESPEILILSLKRRYEKLDLIEFSKILGNVLMCTENQDIEKKSIKKLGEIGLKILLNVIMDSKLDFEYRAKIGKIVTNIAKDHEEKLKDFIKERLIASFQANSYEAIVNLFNTEIITLLNKNDITEISMNSGDKFLEIINKIFDEKYSPAYLEHILSKLGPKGGDLIFKFTQKHEYLDYIFEIMREMGTDIIEPIIKNVILNENNYKYGDWSYEFLQEFFKIFSEDQINKMFDSSEYNLINRLVKTYNSSNRWAKNNWTIINFLVMVYEKLNNENIPKIHTRLTEPMKEEISLYFQESQVNENKSKSKKYNEIVKITGRQNEAIMNLLYTINDISRIVLFEDLRVILKDKEFIPPENMVDILSEIRILLEERIDLFSPENFGFEDKNFIKDFFFEFEKFLQYIIFGYYSSDLNHMLIQLTHFFRCFLVLNKIIHNLVEVNFHYEYMNELRNENYEYYKNKSLFLKAPGWVEKQKILFNKLNLEPHPYPALRARWRKDKREKYITERNNNLKKEFVYYFAKRKYANNIVKSISLEFIDENLKVKIDWKLPESERKQLENLNRKSCVFKINEENAIFGLSLYRKYYRECALEFLRNIKPNYSKNTVIDFVGRFSKINYKKLVQNFKQNLFQKNWKERELTAKDFGVFDKNFKNKSYSQIISAIDEQTKNKVFDVLKEDFPSYRNENPEYLQLKHAIQGLIGINNEYSKNYLAYILKNIKHSDLKEKISVYLQSS